ncbi:hypothetical protein D3C87_1491480 [compost metagenome]
MFAVARRQPRVRRMELMRTRDIDGLYVRVGNQCVDTVVHRSREVPHKLLPRAWPGIAGRNQLDTVVSLERGQHQREGTAEAYHAQSYRATEFHRSITSRSPFARETQIMI